MVPSNRIKEITLEISKQYPAAQDLTNIALILHRYQYNGPDREGSS
ncbi:MAG: hypothetical protein RQ885_06755 [Desulfurococcales archaeon]|nr:hypothetical protein [Desulfurococcales archaeon]